MDELPFGVVDGSRHRVPDDRPAGRALLELVQSGRRVRTGTDGGSCYRLRIHGLCDFEVDRQLREVIVSPDPRADPEQVELLVRGTLTAFVLGLRGHCVLHAAAVVPEGEGGDRTVAIVGTSGMGKSTLASLACRDGASLVCDDLLALDTAHHRTWIGGTDGIRLRRDAWGILDEVRGDWHARPTIDGRIAVQPPRSRFRTGEIATIVIPRPSRHARRVTATVLTPADAALALARFPRLSVWSEPAVLAAEFRGIAALVASVPTVVASVPWGPDFPVGLGDQVLDAVRHTVSAEAPA